MSEAAAAGGSDLKAELTVRFLAAWNRLEPLIQRAEDLNALAGGAPASGFETEADALRRWLHVFRREIDATRAARNAVVHGVTPIDVRDLETYVHAAERLVQVAEDGLASTPAGHAKKVEEIIRHFGHYEMERTTDGADLTLKSGDRTILVEAKSLVHPSSLALSHSAATLATELRGSDANIALLVLPDTAHSPQFVGQEGVRMLRASELKTELTRLLEGEATRHVD